MKLQLNGFLRLNIINPETIIEAKQSKLNNVLQAKLTMYGQYTMHIVTYKPENIFEAKQNISQILTEVLGRDKVNLYCIKPGGDQKLNDEDAFDDDFIIENVLSMDDFEILRREGRGGFAEIFLCRNKRSNKEFVLKKTIEKNADIYRDISIQCRMMNSGHIMIYSGLYNIGESICMAMQYMSQGSIRSYLNNGNRFSENDLLNICYQILLQIRDLHKEGIIHRDIKCDNIVLDEQNNAKLIDFGLSKYFNCLRLDQLMTDLKISMKGTVYFLAPEILKCKECTNKIDIWSFGGVMIEMITGKFPNYKLNWMQAVIKIKNTSKIEFDPPKWISQEFIEFIYLCLNPDPINRPSAEELTQNKIFNKTKIERF